jgi:hypothetical protein
MRVMRASCAKRKTTDAPGALGWRSIVFAAASFLILAAPADAQEATNVGALSGTLKRVKDTGTITLGYRESSLPFKATSRTIRRFAFISPQMRPLSASTRRSAAFPPPR